MKNKKKFFLVSFAVLAIALCVLFVAAASFIQIWGESLMYRWDEETVKARLIESTQERIADLREHLPAEQPIGIAITPDTVGPSACDAMLSKHLHRDPNPPEIYLLTFANEADGRLMAKIAVRFQDKSIVVVDTYQEYPVGCEQLP